MVKCPLGVLFTVILHLWCSVMQLMQALIKFNQISLGTFLNLHLINEEWPFMGKRPTRKGRELFSLLNVLLGTFYRSVTSMIFCYVIDTIIYCWLYWGFTLLQQNFNHITTWKQEITNLWKFKMRGRESNHTPLAPRAETLGNRCSLQSFIKLIKRGMTIYGQEAHKGGEVLIFIVSCSFEICFTVISNLWSSLIKINPIGMAIITLCLNNMPIFQISFFLDISKVWQSEENTILF